MKRKNSFIKCFIKTCPFVFICFASGCQRTINWDFGAKGTLKDESGICFPSSLSGTFYNGIFPGSDTAFVEVKVNVFSPGVYVISTDLQNGLQFFDSGYFSTTGIQSVKLKPRGIAVAPAQTNFNIRFDTSVCSFTLNVEDSSLLNKDLNTWHYTDTKNGITYHGTINATHYLTTSSGNLLSLRQESFNADDTTFQIGVSFPAAISPGIYKTDTLNNFALSVHGRCINCAWGVVYKLKGALTVIEIKSYDPSTKIIKGTFSGTSVDWYDTIAIVKDGSFSAVIK
jgi:hypothetical protein